jgi:hypothetical protein
LETVRALVRHHGSKASDQDSSGAAAEVVLGMPLKELPHKSFALKHMRSRPGEEFSKNS